MMYNKIMSRKICIKCKHHSTYTEYEDSGKCNGEVHTCNHKKVIDSFEKIAYMSLVTGKKMYRTKERNCTKYCDLLRSRPEKCGKDGKWFNPK